MSPSLPEYARDAPKAKCLSNIENRVWAKTYQANEMRKKWNINGFSNMEFSHPDTLTESMRQAQPAPHSHQ